MLEDSIFKHISCYHDGQVCGTKEHKDTKTQIWQVGAAMPRRRKRKCEEGTATKRRRSYKRF